MVENFCMLYTQLKYYLSPPLYKVMDPPLACKFLMLTVHGRSTVQIFVHGRSTVQTFSVIIIIVKTEMTFVQYACHTCRCD